ncbi:ESCRT-III subunit protein [Martiniozyma asiatica (nom. inval.)]|nr:ESCRT-III subunit protein [Martiniozyma asiatica]
MWNYLFGNTQQKKEAPKKAIVDLREHIATLNKKTSYLEKQIEEQQNSAKKYVAMKKPAMAKAALKKKKRFELDLEKISNQVESLETQLTAIESANLNMETMKAMKQGAKAMKQIHTDYNIDKVDETMDDIREQVEISEEISEAISRPLGGEYVDEDELDEELAALEEEEAESNLVETHKQPVTTPATSQKINKMPDAPKGIVHNDQKEQQFEEEDEDERALRELQAEMGM